MKHESCQTIIVEDRAWKNGLWSAQQCGVGVGTLTYLLCGLILIHVGTSH